MPRDGAGMVGGDSVRAQLRRRLSRILDPHFEARQVFYGDDGKVRPGVLDWLNSLARNNFVRTSTFDPDDRVHARNEGRRELALEILGSISLDVAELDRINAQIKEEET